MADFILYVPTTVAHALDQLRNALLELPEEAVFLTDEYLYTKGLETYRNEQALVTRIQCSDRQPRNGLVIKGEVVDPQLDPLLEQATADPEGRALVTAILKRKENNS